jgi:Mn2+/Fe2+ NRAMP family transporter
MLVLSLIIALTGVRPLTLVNTSIVFGMVVMPLTYYPILRIAADPNVMGKHVNNKVVSVLGAIFLVLISVSAVAAIPLMLLTRGGQP